jgi:hypothetical protein
LLDYDDRIICELLEFGAPLGFESNILEENKDIVNHKGARECPSGKLKSKITLLSIESFFVTV